MRNFSLALCTEIVLILLGMSNFLIFSRRTDLRTISLDVGYFADVVIPVGELQNVVAVGVDVMEGDKT